VRVEAIFDMAFLVFVHEDESLLCQADLRDAEVSVLAVLAVALPCMLSKARKR
jgi:hypothetical protein